MVTPEDLRAVGKLLRQRREELGLRKSDVARRVGVTPAYITLIEDATPRRQGKGKPSQPGNDVLTAWAQVLGLDRDQTRTILRVARPIQMATPIDTDTSPRTDDRPPWPPRRELLLQQLNEVLRLAEASAERDVLADLLEVLLQLIRYRVVHASEE